MSLKAYILIVLGVVLGVGVLFVVQNKPASLTAENAQIFPLTKNTKLLDSVQVATRRAPVLFMAPLLGPDDKQSTAADSFDAVLRFQLRAAKPNSYGLNLVPYSYMSPPYIREDGQHNIRNHKPEEFLRDARLLDADVFISGRVTREADKLTVQLRTTDLRTSKTDTWSATQPEAAFADLLADATRACGRFCGLSDTDVHAYGMDKDVPGNGLWQAYMSPDPLTADDARALVKANPDCPCVYDVAYENTYDLAIINAALKKWPEDPRLLRDKYRNLPAAMGLPALQIHSELIRRYPDCFILLSELTDSLVSLYPQADVATAPPPAFTAAVDIMAAFAQRYPKNWRARWDYSRLAATLASYVRGNETADKVPAANFRDFARLSDIATREIDAAVALRPDCPNMLQASIYMHFRSGDYTIQWQRKTIEQIHAVDPSNVAAECQTAYSHSIGWSGDHLFLPIMQEAAKYHANDPRALLRISDEISTDFGRRANFGAGTWDDVYKKADPEVDLFITCVEAAMNAGIQVPNSTAGILRAIYNGRYGPQKAEELMESGKHWALTATAAEDALKAGDYSKCLELARKALPITTHPDGRTLLRYDIVKSLWKLKRYDESLSESNDGIIEFPESQVFHYMSAIVGLEKGDNLEEAYQHAYRAVDICTTNTGCNETFEKLRAKLNKPPHPKLKSM